MKFKTLLCTTTMSLLMVTTAFAAINMTIDGKPLNLDVPPTIVEGRTLVPVRAIFENLGANVAWNNETKEITATKGETIIKLQLDNTTAYINDVATTLDVAATSIDGRTLVPARFVAEATGAKVDWDSSTRTFNIDTKTEGKTDIFTGYTPIEVDGGDLSGHREPNAVVDVGYGDREYYAYTNEYGQLVKVVADKIILQDATKESVFASGRYYTDEAKVLGTEREDLDEGHVIADSLGGVSNAYNITPQNSTLNRYGDQAYMEKVIRDAGGCTNFEAIITYPNTQTQIPSKYKFTYTLKGNVIVDEFENINPDKTIPTENVQEVKIAPTPETKPQATNKETKSQVSTPESKPQVSTEGDLSKVDTNGNGIVTIAEAKAAGYSMPITSDHWLYKYMKDTDGDGMVGE